MSWMDLVDGVGYAVDTPRALTHGLVAKLGDAVRGKPIRSNWRASGREMLESLGVLGPNQEGIDAGDFAGFGAELALDPANLLGAGLGLKLLGKYRKPASQVAEVLSQVDEAPILAERVAEQVPEAVKPVVEAAKEVRPPKPKWERPDLKPGEGPFYSRLERAVEALQGNEFKPQSVINKIKAYPEGVSQEEIDWTRVADFLQGKKTVSKADLLEHVRANRPKVDVVRGSGDYQDYVQPGTEVPGSYVENLFQWKNAPIKGKKFIEDYDPVTGVVNYQLSGNGAAVRAISDPNGVDWRIVTSSPDMDSYVSKLSTADENTVKSKMEDLLARAGGVESPHFPQKNILAHGRSTKRDTSLGRMLLGEEQQSDWFQDARKFGFNDEPVPPLKWEKGPEGDLFASDFGNVYRNGDSWFTNASAADRANPLGFKTPEEAMAYVDAIAEGERASMRMPRAPMSESWPDLVLKKQLYDAASDPKVDYFGLPSGKGVQSVTGGELAGQQQFYDKDQVARVNRLLKKFGVSMEDAGGLADAANQKVADRLTRELERLDGIRKRLLDDEAAGGLRELPESPVDNLGDFIPGADLQLIPESKLDRLDMMINRRINNAGLHPHDVYDPMGMSDQGPMAWRGDLRSTIASALRGVRPQPVSRLAKITPEMRQEILRKGFPLMSLALASLLGPQLMDEGA